MGIFDWFKNIINNIDRDIKSYSTDDDIKNKSLRVHYNDLEDINGITIYQDKPFTGLFFNYYPNGNLSFETKQLNGKCHGESIRYNGDGTINCIINFSHDTIPKKDEYMKNMVWEVIHKREILFQKGELIEEDPTEVELNHNRSEFSDLDILAMKKVVDEDSEFHFLKNKVDKIFEKRFLNEEDEELKKWKEEIEEDKLIKKNKSNSKPTKKSLNSNNKVWNRNLEILPPHNIPLFGEIASDNSSFTYYRKNKPFSGIVYYLFNEEERDFSSLKEKEKQKIIQYEIDIKNGIKDGEQRIFNEQQDLITKIEVKNDIKNGFERGYNNNKIITENFYENGIKNGLETSYYENGQIQSQMEWVNGKCTGKNKFFDQNGNLLTETTYKNGKHIGPQKCWNEIGEEIDCDLTPFQVKETIISSEKVEVIKKQKKEDD